MNDILPDLCDENAELVRVLAPMFRNFGKRSSFGGRISTIKCHEDNSLVAAAVEEPGAGRVLVVDGGGSLRCALLGDNLAMRAAVKGWQGVVVYGCVRDVDTLAETDIGIQALAAHPLRSVKRNAGRRDEVVTFGGVNFIAGEYCYADNNGILVSPVPLKLPG